jgi:uncharacterized protein YcbK (DUF882 family)
VHAISRRQFLKLGMAVTAAGLLPPLRTVWAALPAQRLSFYHRHTGETLSLTYRENGFYIPAAMEALNHFLRDWRTGEVYTIDPLLLNQLHTLQQHLEAVGPYHVICGYRSPRTNQVLHAHSSGVASRSLHMEGRAIDICLPGKDLAFLHRAALDMHAGGVGYYPDSDFIHLDTGRVRRW